MNSAGGCSKRVEELALLGGSGVDLILSCQLRGASASVPGHPMVQTLLVQVDPRNADDVDIPLSTRQRYNQM